MVSVSQKEEKRIRDYTFLVKVELSYINSSCQAPVLHHHQTAPLSSSRPYLVQIPVIHYGDRGSFSRIVGILGRPRRVG